MTLRELRERKRLTQTELARKVGVTQPMICSWETGVYAPRLRVRDKLAAALEVDGPTLDRSIAEGREIYVNKR